MGLGSFFGGKDIDLLGSNKGKNDFFAKPFGVGSGSASEFFSPTNRDVGAARHTFTGFDPKELANFQKAAGGIASSKKRVDVDSLAPKEKSLSVTTQEFNRQLREGKTLSVTEDQMKGFVSAFTLRQDEVFGKRAKPGLSQTRLV